MLKETNIARDHEVNREIMKGTVRHSSLLSLSRVCRVWRLKFLFQRKPGAAPSSILSAEAGGLPVWVTSWYAVSRENKTRSKRDESLHNMMPQNEALSVNPRHSQKAQHCDLHLQPRSLANWPC